LARAWNSADKLVMEYLFKNQTDQSLCGHFDFI
jgi:hypothetical protein